MMLKFFLILTPFLWSLQATAERVWDCHQKDPTEISNTAPYTVVASATNEDCYILNAKVFDPSGSLVDEHKDRYVSVYEHLPRDFPYLVLLVDSGGSGCCRNYYFYSHETPYRKVGELLHGAIWLKTFREDDGYFVVSHNKSVKLLR